MTDPQPCTPQQIADLALQMHGSRLAIPVDQVLMELRRAAVELLPAADYASITVVTKRRRGLPTKLGALVEDSVCKQIGALHDKHGQGPCYDAVQQPTPVMVRSVTTETRWPAVMAAIVEYTPVRSLTSIPLRAAGQAFGALNLFADQPDAFSTETCDTAAVLATHAAIAVSAADRVEGVHRALESRDLIGQVKGMLMERWSVDATQAFAILSKLSQEANVPLVQVCTQLINAAGRDSTATAVTFDD